LHISPLEEKSRKGGKEKKKGRGKERCTAFLILILLPTLERGRSWEEGQRRKGDLHRYNYSYPREEGRIGKGEKKGEKR